MQTGPGHGRSCPSLQDRHSSSLTRLPNVTSPEVRCQAHKVDEARQRPVQGETRQSRSKEPWVQPAHHQQSPYPTLCRMGCRPREGQGGPWVLSFKTSSTQGQANTQQELKALPESPQGISSGFELGREAG